MQNFDYSLLLIILPFTFIGGFIDSIAGGGGVLFWIGYLLSGIPMHFAYGANKVAATFGTATSSFNYIREGHFNKWYLPFGIVGIIVGSTIGSYFVTITSDEVLRMIMIIVLPIIACTLMVVNKCKKQGNVKLSKNKIFLFTFISCLIIGMYGSFIGPGAGTFLIIAFNVMGLDIIEAGGNAKIINFMMALISAIIFTIKGFVLWQLAIPCIITIMIANYLGSKLAIKGGERIIKPVMVLVFILLAIKTVMDVFIIK